MNTQKIGKIKLFMISFISILLSFVPEFISGKGFFIYAGDYTYQNIPFCWHMSEVLQNHKFGWDWLVNLGTDFIGAFSYYSLGSIFFLLVSWIPNGKIIVFLMPFVTALKVSVASLTSYTYIRKKVKNDYPAFLGALMYAFSGYQLANTIFYSFADSVALFPLLLISLDNLVKENKKGCFSVMVALMALNNYFFFYAQVVFVILYYIVMCIKKDYCFNVKNFLFIVAESLMGVLSASVLIVPSFFSVFSVGRASDYLYGVDMVSYSDNTIIPRLLQSIFMLPDPEGRSLLFDSEIHNWSAVSLYLPVFTVVGVWEFLKRNKSSAVTVILKISFISMLIPVLNSVFYMFNRGYYTRWFYMPVLFMCLATAISIDEKYDLVSGIKLEALGLLIFAVISVFPDKVYTVSDTSVFNTGSMEYSDGEISWFRMSNLYTVLIQYFGFAAAGLMIVYYYNKNKDKNKDILKRVSAITVLFIVISSAAYYEHTKNEIQLVNLTFKETALDYKPELEGDEFYRICDVNTSMINNNFIWGYPTISSFHSIDTSENEAFFNKTTTEPRYFRNNYTEKDFPLYGLFSVKYIFNHSSGDDLNVENTPVQIPGFELYDKQEYFYIYENKHFVPMGYTYDYYITEEKVNEYLDSCNINDEIERRRYLQLILMRALIVSEDTADIYSDYIAPLPYDMLTDLNEMSYLADCDQRSVSSCSNFEYDSNGFKAEITTDNSELLFFSVPASRGWKAYVNGKEADIITSQFGFSSVPVDSGYNNIEFKYESYGLRVSLYMSVIGASIIIVYIITNILIYRKKYSD